MDEGAVDLLSCTLRDANDTTVGAIVGYLPADGAGQPAFALVRSGLARRRHHLVPLGHAKLDAPRRVVRVPYPREQVLNAPVHAPDIPLDAATREHALAHYRQAPEGFAFGAQPPQAEIPLHEEHVDVTTRVVQAGGVRVRKVVRREIVHVPVEVLREELVFERVGPDEVTPGEPWGALPREPFREGALFLPEYREEPVIHKRTEVVEAARLRREVETRHEVVRAEARREDVEVDRFPPGHLRDE